MLPNRPPPRTDPSPSRSSERKRRLTTADSPGRRPSSIRTLASNPGASNADPIMIDSSPAPARLPLPPSPPAQQASGPPPRRESDLVLPPWQPDTDVSQCPVCSRSFHFLYRKHHCRKCGRVVCAACSPHRITIPRQFIVHPPSDALSHLVDLTGDDDDTMSPFGPLRNPALGGGEEVRVCNPCVPDPNYGPPPQYAPSVSSRHASQSSNHYYPQRPPTHTRAHRSSSSVHDASRTAGHGQTQRPHAFASDNRRVSYGAPPSAAERWLPPLPSTNMLQRPSESHSTSPRYATPHNRHLPFNLGPGTQSVVNMFPRSPSTAVPPSGLLRSQPPPPRRQIAEEDECPICGYELPPKGPDDDETARQQHIEECIALHSASPAPMALGQRTSASLPTQRTRGMSNAAEASTSRAAHAARGMFTFTATEKDCVNAEGEEEECIICFEEYEAGDGMARLVCWCKFHELHE
ncbi:hypothetical protein ACEQ8H_002689 [Pleosporales sp. CAS-2024a]